MRFDTHKDYYEDFQIEVNDTRTEYIPHEEQAYNMPVQREMIDAEDYFDWENEEEVHTWEKIVYDGSDDEGWQVNTYFKNTFYCNLPANLDKDDLKMVCNVTNNIIKLTSSVTTVKNAIVIGSALNIKLKGITTLEDLKTCMSNTNIIVYYKSTQEERLAFIEEQKAVAEQIKKAHSYKNITHMYSTDEVSANIEAEYYQDNETLNKNNMQALQTQIDELKTAVVALGGV